MRMLRHRLLPALVVVAVGVPLAASGAQPAEPSPDRVVAQLRAGAPGQWSPLHAASDGSLAIALADGSTALVSVGGDHDATVFDQRLAADGSLGPRAEVTSLDDVEDCRVVDAATAVSNLAVAVECAVKTGVEEPPTRLLQLVWRGDDGWVWKVRPEGEIGSVDYSPQGQYALFTSNSGYGRPHHLTSYHPDLGWRDLARPELPLNTGEDMIAAINDTGSLLTVRSGGYEEEPGSWYGGLLRIDGYNASTEEWTTKHTRRRPSGGFTARAVDVAGGRFVATVSQNRSTGELYGRDSRVLVLSGKPSHPRSWTSRWTYGVAAGRAAITDSGVGVVAWQAAGKPDPTDLPLGASPVSQLRSWVATWAPSRGRPTAERLAGSTTEGNVSWYDRSLDLSVDGDGRGVVAHVRHERDATDWAVTARSFTVGPRGRMRGAIEQTWRLPADPTLDVVASRGNTSITLGSLVGPEHPAPDVQYAVRAPDATPRR
ncbi:hypothetical protein EUA93_00540 [Nocardioides oleivorans]|uniref:WD40 repeat domain-containing protein n=1 Tax=Nocardioides oleivorans TaxID=273676 RepID=A0A4Q2RUZ0_9ACTN|nr:hypothetical protein [Nocardioides oleivorans]RYB92970.1 hypothetical protein EUA93_00540 [Nocardioides oleivorans]